MRLLDLFLYQIRPFGIVDQRPSTPEPPPDLDLKESPWFAPNVTTTISPDTTVRTRSSEEIQQSQLMHQHLLEYLLNQLKPYGIVDPNEFSNVNAMNTSNPNRTTEVIVNPEQLEYLRGYVMDQLEPFGIVGPNDHMTASPTLAPTTTTTTAIMPIISKSNDVIAINQNTLNVDAIIDSQRMQQYLRDYMMNQFLHSQIVDPNEKMIASHITTPSTSTTVTKSVTEIMNNNPTDIDARSMLLQLLRSLETAQGPGSNAIPAH